MAVPLFRPGKPKARETGSGVGLGGLTGPKRTGLRKPSHVNVARLAGFAARVGEGRQAALSGGPTFPVSPEEPPSHEIPDLPKRRKQTLSKLRQRQLEPGHQDDVKAAHKVVEGKGAAGEVDGCDGV